MAGSSSNRARVLRRSSTFAERLVWSRLKNRAIRNAKFRRQHPIGPYVADFACVDAKLVVELDGGQHADPDQADQDARRTAFLEAQGWRVLRFWNSDVLNRLDSVCREIGESLFEQQHRTR
ncbi:MAG: endonuclease domain-containing protein [Pseudomonadota bacterium]